MDFREYALRCVEQELAEHRALGAEEEANLAERARRRGGVSLVYSLRLDRHEIAVLHRRAARMGIKPSALARNLIREGLARRPGPAPWD